MNHAPSVTCRVVRSRSLLWLWLLPWLVAAVATGLWAAQAPTGDGGPFLSCLALAISGGVTIWQWWASPTGALRWDGTRWCWLSRTDDAAKGECTGGLLIVLDMQRHVLARFRGDRGVRYWLWLSRKNCHQDWLALRRAAFFSKQNEVQPTNGSSAHNAAASTAP